MDDEDAQEDFQGSDALALPRANVQKLIKQYAPDIKISAELVDIVGKCCTEFVEMLSSSANSESAKDKKNTILPEHVLAAIDQLELTELRDPVNSFVQEWKDNKAADNQARAKRKAGADKSGMSEEEQIEWQKALFEQARAQAAGQDLP